MSVGWGTMNDSTTRGTAIVVGGSLAGLLSTIALSYAGFTVTVLERTRRQGIEGAMLRVTPSVTPQITRPDGSGTRAPSLRTIASGGHLTSVEGWETIHGRLRDAASSDARVTVRDGVGVVAADQDADHAWVDLASGDRVFADLVIGADGYRSVVRRVVAPERPDALYAGYTLWVGRIAESDLPRQMWLPRGDNGVMEYGDNILFAHALAGPDGSMSPGRRELVYAIYDARHNADLRRLGVIQGPVVQHSLRGRDIPDGLLAQIIDDLDEWPRPWRLVIGEAVRRRQITGTPTAEYVPLRLASGRIALVGNAAHVPTPMTGSGFDASVADAEALMTAVALAEDPADVPDALLTYEADRLHSAQRLVESGQSFSRSFARAS